MCGHFIVVTGVGRSPEVRTRSFCATSPGMWAYRACLGQSFRAVDEVGWVVCMCVGKGDCPSLGRWAPFYPNLYWIEDKSVAMWYFRDEQYYVKAIRLHSLTGYSRQSKVYTMMDAFCFQGFVKAVKNKNFSGFLWYFKAFKNRVIRIDQLSDYFCLFIFKDYF